jgi:hypothetical protein
MTNSDKSKTAGYRPAGVEEKGYKPEVPAKLPPPTNPGPSNSAPPPPAKD